MIMIVKTPGSRMGSPAAAEEGGEEMGGEKCESGERSEVQSAIDGGIDGIKSQIKVERSCDLG